LKQGEYDPNRGRTEPSATDPSKGGPKKPMTPYDKK